MGAASLLGVACPGIEWMPNPLRGADAPPAAGGDAPDFHRALPGYARTPLVDAPELAAEWGVGSVRLKFERERFGLPAFIPRRVVGRAADAR